MTAEMKNAAEAAIDARLTHEGFAWKNDDIGTLLHPDFHRSITNIYGDLVNLFWVRQSGGQMLLRALPIPRRIAYRMAGKYFDPTDAKFLNKLTRFIKTKLAKMTDIVERHGLGLVAA